jgi:glycogen(starch) synthase
VLPRRVLMTADTVGGVWEYSLDLSRALAAAGVSVTLATMGGEPSPRQRRAADTIPSLTLRTSTWKLEWMAEPWDDVDASGGWLLELDGAIRPDVIHLNGFCHGALPWSAPVLMVAHSCVLSWWESVKGEVAPPASDTYRRAARQGLTAAGCVVAPSRWMAGEIQRLYGVKTAAISNGRDRAAGFAPGGDKQPVVLAAGRLWDPAKNLAALDRACAGVSWPLYLAGPAQGPFGDVFVAENGTMLGPLAQTELATWMRQASIYALPAKYEPFGLSALEAALCGCALVLGDIPSLRENWEGAALFVDPDDPSSIRGALDALIDTPELLDSLGRRAAQRARQFTTQRMADGYLAAYAQLIEAARAPEPRATSA